MPNIECLDENNIKRKISVMSLPGICPICHEDININEEVVAAFLSGRRENLNNKLQIIFRCPIKDCKNIFIGYYIPDSLRYKLEHLRPYNLISVNFSEEIKSISSNFVVIYNQSYHAEQLGLFQVCGPGYRKSLEFLIKDFLIIKNPKTKSKISGEFLGQTIEKRIKNRKIKEVAKRAVWLGNDETHYERRWLGKDLQDLKNLINLTVSWIENEERTERAIKDMSKN
jgi:hypothetical protein